MNRAHHLLPAAVVLALAGAFTPSAHAYNSNSNRQIIPLGETEAFLGNAGVGRANDTGAVYYNPSGLAELSSGRVSVTGSAYLSFDTRTDGAFFVDQTTVGYEASGFNTIPAFYVAAYKMDDWVTAISVLVPNSLQVESRSPFTTPSTQSTIIAATKSSDLWIGLSAARKVDEHWNLGVTLFAIQHQEATTVGLDMTFPANPTTSLTTSMEQVTLATIGLSATFGITYLPDDPQWRFGLRAQTSLVQLGGNADTFISSHKETGGVIASTVEDKRATEAHYQLPFDFTLGSAYIANDWLTVLADVSMQLGADYSSIPGSTVTEQVNLKPTPRFNLGMEFKTAKWMQLRTGFFYNPSANGQDSNTPGYSAEDFYGLTAGIGINSAKVRTGVGVFYVWSSGQSIPTGSPSTTPSKSNSRGTGLVLTTSFLL